MAAPEITGDAAPGLRAGVVLGGHGAVGSAFAALLARGGVRVTVVDPAPGAVDGVAETLAEDARAPSPRCAALLARADTVVVALSEERTLAVLPALAAAMAPDALLVDVCSVKRQVVALERTLPLRHVLSLNPMFTPSLDPRGRALAAVVVRGGAPVEAMLRHWTGRGARVVRLAADEHDRATAAIQVLTHAAVLSAGLALGELGVPVELLDALATPPHRALLALLARMATGTPEAYREIQSTHPYGTEARTALRRGLEALDAAATGPDPDAVPAILLGARALLGADLERHARRAAWAFAALTDHDRPDDRPDDRAAAPTEGAVTPAVAERTPS